MTSFIALVHRADGVREKASKDLVRSLDAAAAVAAEVENQALRALRIQLVQLTIQVGKHFAAVRQCSAGDDEIIQSQVANPTL